MRIGQNPNKRAQCDSYPKVLIEVTTHLPNEEGYHEHRLEIVQKSLLSARKNAGMDAGFMVWDNGSCPKLRDWLANEFKPDYMIFTPNLGKVTARYSVLNMLPPKTIVALSDDDMLYYPDWLKKQVEIIDHFPNVGMVTGYINRASFRWGCENTLRWGVQNGKVTTGKFIPDEWERDYAVSVGFDPDLWMKKISNEDDAIIEYNGIRAYATSHHCQFVCVAERIKPYKTLVNIAMVDERYFDEDVDKAGLLRLATVERLTRHMGNVMDDKVRFELEAMGI